MNKLETLKQMYEPIGDSKNETVTYLLAQLEKCREALEFYGSEENWKGPGAPFNEDVSRKMIIVATDTEGNNWLGGKKARACLKDVFGGGE